MSTNRETYTKGRSSSITEYAPNEINRTTREKGIKTLQDIRNDHLRYNNLAADNVKDFLQDTNTSFSSEDGKLPNDVHRLEKRITKQQYLVNNKLFDPTEYFGGLDISNLDEHTVDQRLEDMFQQYLPTEVEDKEDVAQSIVKQTQSDKPQSKPISAPKQLDVSKTNWNSKEKGYPKPDVYKSLTKDFPETTKASKDVIEFDVLSPLSATHAKMHSNFKKEFGQNLLNKAKNPPVKVKAGCQTATNVIQEYKPVVIAHKKKKSAGLSDKENKGEERDHAHLRTKKSASVSKKPNTSDLKSNYRAISDVNSTSFVPKSANTSLSRNNRSTVQDGHQNYSLNTTAKVNLSQQNSTKTEIERKFTVSEKTSAKDEPSQRVGSAKLDTQSTGRSKTKSSDQFQGSQSLRRSRKARKNFSSFNSTLTTEDEPEFLFKSFNTRPQTSHTVAIDENNYVLKGILSPTITKNLVSKGINKAVKNAQKGADKPQPVNPLKFLNDLLNKRKISTGSADHLRMPKKPTFLENKVGSPGAQLGPKHSKTPSKSDLFEARITNHVNKKAQGVNMGNYASANNFKSLFTLKNFEK